MQARSLFIFKLPRLKSLRIWNARNCLTKASSQSFKCIHGLIVHTIIKYRTWKKWLRHLARATNSITQSLFLPPHQSFTWPKRLRSSTTASQREGGLPARVQWFNALIAQAVQRNRQHRQARPLETGRQVYHAPQWQRREKTTASEALQDQYTAKKRKFGYIWTRLCLPSWVICKGFGWSRRGRKVLRYLECRADIVGTPDYRHPQNCFPPVAGILIIFEHFLYGMNLKIDGQEGKRLVTIVSYLVLICFRSWRTERSLNRTLLVKIPKRVSVEDIRWYESSAWRTLSPWRV